MNHFCVCPWKREHKKPVVGGEMAPVQLLNHQSRVIKNEKREPEAARGVELLCNYNMVLKSKYQALATSARRQRKKGVAERRGQKKLGRGELRSATESDPAMTSAHQQSSPASWSQGQGRERGAGQDPLRFMTDYKAPERNPITQDSCAA